MKAKRIDTSTLKTEILKQLKKTEISKQLKVSRITIQRVEQRLKVSVSLKYRTRSGKRQVISQKLSKRYSKTTRARK